MSQQIGVNLEKIAILGPFGLFLDPLGPLPDDDMRVDPSDVTLSPLIFPFLDTKSPNMARSF